MKNLEKLKQDWLRDPCWDIEETEGYENHYEELKSFRLAVESNYEKKELNRLELKAESLGMTIKKVKQLELLEYKAKDLEEDSKRYFVHYFKVLFEANNLAFTNDEQSEIELAVELLINAAIAKMESKTL